MPDLMKITRDVLATLRTEQRTPADAAALSKKICARLRLADDPAWMPTRGTRADALDYLGRMIEEFADLCDLADGYSDDSEDGDPFSAFALSTYRDWLAAIRRGEVCAGE